MRNIFILAGGVIKELIRRKDFYFILALLIMVIVFSATFSFGGQTGLHRYFKEICISLAYIFSVIIAITFAARQIPQEIESKTIYPLLAHPVSRWEFIVGKFLGVLIVSILSFTLFYLIFIVSMIARGDLSTPPILFIEAYILHIFLLSFFASLTILASFFLSVAANSQGMVILYFGMNWFGATLPGYIWLPHPELFDIKEKVIHALDIVPPWVMLFMAGYGIIYTALFLMASYLVFRRRNI